MKSWRDNGDTVWPWFARAVIILVSVAATAGCGSSRADRAQVPDPVDSAPDEHTADGSTAVETATSVAGTEDVNAENLAPATADAAADDASRETNQSPAIPAERFLLLSPAGPLVCELSVVADGQGQTGSLEKLVDEAMQAASSGSDGAPAWNAMVEARPFRYGQFGNAPMKTAEERQQAIRRYDWNRDGRVDRDEMRRLLTRNQHTTGSMIVRSDDADSGGTAVGAPSWQWLDTDGDQQLSAAEIRSSPDRLLARDERDDELLVTGELSPDAAPTDDDRGNTPPPQATLALALSADTDWQHLLGAFHDAYPGMRSSSAPGARRAVALFHELDANGSGSLSAEELGALRSREPHLKIIARLGPETSEDAPALSVAPEVVADMWNEVTRDPATGAVLLVADGQRLEWLLARQVGDGAYGADAAKSQFSAYDSDGNGYLDRNELAPAEQAIGPFDGLDLNGDEKVYVDELSTYLARQQTATRSTIQVTVRRSADAVFDALDVDRDQRLGAREIAGAPARLTVLDANHDDRLTPDEIPNRLTVEIDRGARPNNSMPTMPMTSPTAPRAARHGPIWFQRMDANGDGDLSRREFLGSSERFDELDTNQDEFIDATEAEQADTLRGGEQSPNAHAE